MNESNNPQDIMQDSQEFSSLIDDFSKEVADDVSQCLAISLDENGYTVSDDIYEKVMDCTQSSVSRKLEEILVKSFGKS